MSIPLLLALIALFVSFSQEPLKDPRERHLTNIKQLTFGGENAEAYFSPDGHESHFPAR
jgi:hypothetical protein